jgi:cation:H+ antiporter
VLSQPVRWVLAPLLLCVYAAYVVATLRSGQPSEKMPEPLHLVRWGRNERPHAVPVALQLVIAVALLIGGSQIFVESLTAVSDALRLPAMLLALLLVPLATEFPETMSSVLWVRSDDDGLAFGNVAGSAAFQACLLGAFGMAFTPWRPSPLVAAAGVITLAMALTLLVVMRRGRIRGWALGLCGLPWLAMGVVILITRA